MNCLSSLIPLKVTCFFVHSPKNSSLRPPSLKWQRLIRSAGERSGKQLVGVDIYIDARESPASLEKKLSAAEGRLKLIKIHNRGVCVWPTIIEGVSCVDQWRCRFVAQEKGGVVTHEEILATLQNLIKAGLDVIQTQNLYTFDGAAVYSHSADENG